MSEHERAGTTDPYDSIFEAQRRTIEQSRRLFHQGVDLQRRSMSMMMEGMDSQRSLQRKGTDVVRTATEASIDAMEASVPMGAPAFESMHAVVRDQFAATNDLTDQSWEAVRAGMEDATRSYEELLDDYVDIVDDSMEAYMRTLDEFDSDAESVDVEGGE